jgi:hypothetical protein
MRMMFGLSSLREDVHERAAPSRHKMRKGRIVLRVRDIVDSIISSAGPELKKISSGWMTVNDGPR